MAMDWAYVAQDEDGNWGRTAPKPGGRRIPMSLWDDYEDALNDAWELSEIVLTYKVDENMVAMEEMVEAVFEEAERV